MDLSNMSGVQFEDMDSEDDGSIGSIDFDMEDEDDDFDEEDVEEDVAAEEEAPPPPAPPRTATTLALLHTPTRSLASRASPTRRRNSAASS